MNSRGGSCQTSPSARMAASRVTLLIHLALLHLALPDLATKVLAENTRNSQQDFILDTFLAAAEGSIQNFGLDDGDLTVGTDTEEEAHMTNDPINEDIMEENHPYIGFPSIDKIDFFNIAKNLLTEPPKGKIHQNVQNIVSKSSLDSASDFAEYSLLSSLLQSVDLASTIGSFLSNQGQENHVAEALPKMNTKDLILRPVVDFILLVINVVVNTVSMLLNNLLNSRF